MKYIQMKIIFKVKIVFYLLNLLENVESEFNENNKNIKLENEIQKIKDIRNKKRKIQHTDENYDQDFVEIKNIKTDVLLNGKMY